MPLSFIIDHFKKRIYSRASGVLTFGDLLDHMQAEVDQDVRRFSEVFDCRGANSHITSGEMSLLAIHRKEIAGTQGGGPVAVLVDSDHMFEVFKIFELRTEGARQFQIFRGLEQAEAWLDSL